MFKNLKKLRQKIQFVRNTYISIAVVKVRVDDPSSFHFYVTKKNKLKYCVQYTYRYMYTCILFTGVGGKPPSAQGLVKFCSFLGDFEAILGWRL